MKQNGLFGLNGVLKTSQKLTKMGVYTLVSSVYTLPISVYTLASPLPRQLFLLMSIAAHSGGFLCIIQGILSIPKVPGNLFKSFKITILPQRRQNACKSVSHIYIRVFKSLHNCVTTSTCDHYNTPIRHLSLYVIINALPVKSRAVAGKISE